MTRSGRRNAIRWRGVPAAMLLALFLPGCSCPPTPAPQNPETGVIIVLQQGQDPSPKSCGVSKSRHQDHVRWDNRTDADRTLTFQTGIWPFTGTAAPIIVPAHGMSDWYTVRSDIQVRAYPYHVEAPLKEPPPGEPDISGQE